MKNWQTRFLVWVLGAAHCLVPFVDPPMLLCSLCLFFKSCAALWQIFKLAILLHFDFICLLLFSTKVGVEELKPPDLWEHDSQNQSSRQSNQNASQSSSYVGESEQCTQSTMASDGSSMCLPTGLHYFYYSIIFFLYIVS